MVVVVVVVVVSSSAENPNNSKDQKTLRFVGGNGRASAGVLARMEEDRQNLFVCFVDLLA